jgi:hypothetical protein
MRCYRLFLSSLWAEPNGTPTWRAAVWRTSHCEDRVRRWLRDPAIHALHGVETECVD